jgi:glutamyl-tRNA synthetase/nondiscriminating glutamyl-tRNA synthetase
MINEKMKISDIETIKKALEITIDLLKSNSDEFSDIEEIKNAFIEKIKAENMKNGQVLWPVRCALS